MAGRSRGVKRGGLGALNSWNERQPRPPPGAGPFPTQPPPGSPPPPPGRTPTRPAVQTGSGGRERGGRLGEEAAHSQPELTGVFFARSSCRLRGLARPACPGAVEGKAAQQPPRVGVGMWRGGESRAWASSLPANQRRPRFSGQLKPRPGQSGAASFLPPPPPPAASFGRGLRVCGRGGAVVRRGPPETRVQELVVRASPDSGFSSGGLESCCFL